MSTTALRVCNIRAMLNLMLCQLQEHVDIRDQITKSRFPSTDELRPLVAEIARRIVANGRDEPVPKLRCENAVPQHGAPRLLWLASTDAVTVAACFCPVCYSQTFFGWDCMNASSTCVQIVPYDKRFNELCSFLLLFCSNQNAIAFI